MKFDRHFGSSGFETLGDLTKRRLSGYWDGALVCDVTWCCHAIELDTDSTLISNEYRWLDGGPNFAHSCTTTGHLCTFASLTNFHQKYLSDYYEGIWTVRKMSSRDYTATVLSTLHCVLTEHHQTSDISDTLAGNKIVDHSDVVGASPVGAAPTASSYSA